MAASGQSRQGQNVREKFFLDFASATAKSSDPFRSQRKTETVEWLPDLLFIEPEQPLNSYDAEQSVSELKALFMQVEASCQSL